jgi:hypothetical protein
VSDGVSFSVGEAGAPNLAGEGQEAPPPDDVAGPQPVLVDLWTPQETSALLSAVFNVGVLFYGERWAAHPAEFQASGTLLAPTLDRYLPKAAGGGLATMGLGLVSVAGEMAAATARRWHLIKAGPKPVWIPRQQQQPTPADRPAAAAAEPKPAPESSTSSYKMPPDLVQVVERAAQASALVGMGL